VEPVNSISANGDHPHFYASVVFSGGTNRDGIADIIISAKEYGVQAFAYYGIAERLLLPVILH
jgi:hypothetical protein